MLGGASSDMEVEVLGSIAAGLGWDTGALRRNRAEFKPDMAYRAGLYRGISALIFSAAFAFLASAIVPPTVLQAPESRNTENFTNEHQAPYCSCRGRRNDRASDLAPAQVTSESSAMNSAPETEGTDGTTEQHTSVSLRAWVPMRTRGLLEAQTSVELDSLMAAILDECQQRFTKVCIRPDVQKAYCYQG